MVLDAETLALAPRAAELIAAAEGADLPGTLKSELFASALELNTGVCESAAEGAAHARRAPARSGRASRRSSASGSRPPGAIRQPCRGAGDRRRAALRGVRRVRGRLGPAAGRQRAPRPRRHAERGGLLPRTRRRASLAAGGARLVGELAVLRRARRRGSSRTGREVLAQLPRSGAPPAFRSYADWEEFVERFIRLGLADDYTRFWWDIRPHPRFGTLEIRMPDQPTELGRTVGFVALLEGAVRRSRSNAPLAPHDPAGRGDVPAEPLGGLALRARRRARASRTATATGAGVASSPTELAALAGEETLDPTRMEADRQLEVGRDARPRGRLRRPRRAHARLEAWPF